MGVMEAIKKGFSVATKNLGLVLVLFVFNAIWNLISIPMMPKPGETPTPQATTTAVIFSILFILISIFVQGGALGTVKDYIKEGKTALGKFASYGLKYYLKLLVLGILIVLIIAVVGLVAALIVAATVPLNNTIVTIIATIIAIAIGVVGLYYILLLMLSPYTLVCDDMGVFDAMKKSLRVVRKALGKIIALLVLLVLISLGIGFIVGFLAGLVAVVLPVTAGQVVIGLVNSVFNGYLGIVLMASFMTIYLALSEKEKTAAQKVF